MKFTLEIDMDNAAFEDGYELSRILNEVAYDHSGVTNDSGFTGEGFIRDINGNTVGRWEITDGKPKITHVVAYIVVDDDADLSWLTQSDVEMGPDFQASAGERLDAFRRCEWFMVGVYVSLRDEDDQEVLASGGLWNIESDSSDEFFDDLIREQICQLEIEHDVELSGLPFELRDDR